MKSPKTVIVFVFALTALAIIGYCIKSLDQGHDQNNSPISILPLSDGYSELPIAENVLVSREIEDSFNASEIIYSDLGNSVSLFAMAWSQNQLRPSMAGMHVPDNCFVANGMVIKKKEKLEFGQNLPKAEYREFDANGKKLYVIYWHFVDGKTIDYLHYGNGRTIGYFIDNWRSLFGKYNNMIYFRIVSEKPFTELTNYSNLNLVLVEIERTLTKMAQS